MKCDFFKCICLALILLCQTYSSFAVEKSDKIKPRWLTHELPDGQSMSYIFILGHGEGVSLASARQQAFVSMSQRLEVERGLTVSTSVKIKEQFSQNQVSTDTDYHQEIVLDVTEQGHQLKIICRVIDEYWEHSNSSYSVDVLYTVADKNMFGGSYNDKITVTAKYDNVGFLSIVPGVAQLYKGSTVKGSAIIGGEILAVGGIVLCESTRASYVKKMYEQPKYASIYNSRADNWETGRDICIAATVAIYVYNVIDAFVATGAKYVVINNRKAGLSVVPHIDSRTFGVGLALNF